MKWVFFFFLISLVPFVHASTNCSVGCDVDGGTLVSIHVKFTSWNNSANDGFLIVRDQNSNIVAYKNTNSISLWGGGTTLNYLADIDGNFSFQVQATGVDNNYNLEILHKNGGIDENYAITGCVGTGCGGATDNYSLIVSNAPPINFNDGLTIAQTVKGGTIATASIRFRDGVSGGDATVSIVDSTGKVMAYRNTNDWTLWSNSPVKLPWYPEKDGNYSLQVSFSTGWSDFDLNYDFTDTNNTLRHYEDKYQHIGSSLSTGNVADYNHHVNLSPFQPFTDGAVMPVKVKGGTMLRANMRFIDGTIAGDVDIRVKNSAGETLALESTNDYSNWSNGNNFNWFADHDGNYFIETFFNFAWGYYDLNVDFTDTTNTVQHYEDHHTYIGSAIGTGNFADYNFGVAQSPSLNLDDDYTMPDIVKPNQLFKARIRYVTGVIGSDANFSIRDINGNTYATISTLDIANWANPQTIQFTPTANNIYYLDLGLNTSWAQYDLNVDFINTSDVNKHYEDFGWIGSGIQTGNNIRYYFNVGQGFQGNSLVNNISESSDPVSPGSTFQIYNQLKDNFGNAITDADVDIIFNGVEYDNFDYNSILGKYVWSHSESNIGTYDYAVKAHKALINDDQDSGTITVYSEDSLPSETCIPVRITGDSSERIDVVFVGSGFPDLNTFGWVVEDMIDYDGNDFGIMHYSPFKENKEKFNFWKVNTTQTFGGGMVFNGLTWKHDKTYHAQARQSVISNCGSINESTPQFITLLVAPKVRPHAESNFLDFGSGAAYITIGSEYYGSCNISVPPFCAFPTGSVKAQDFTIFDQNILIGSTRQEIQSVLVHEFGHSFGGLADEYLEDNVLSNVKLAATFSANCDNNFLGNACSKWGSITNSCFPGCTTSYYFRPFEKSMMREPDVFSDLNFLPVSQHELEKDINSYFEVLGLSSKSNNYSYLVNLTNVGDELSLDEISIIDQKTNPSITSNGNYQVLIKDTADLVLYDVNIHIPTGNLYIPSTDWFDENGNQIFVPDQNDYITDANTQFSISFPYFSTGKIINFIDVNGANVLTIDLSDFQTKINYLIGYGGYKSTTANYITQYQLVPQPVGVISSSNYISHLGPLPK